ncbi:hypothetical protein ACFVJ5_28930 [Nocardia sp. NPDC127606]|uniref:hypothetical protein n=1 Tax=Nocardia sp. NPDC127606 TaxID=3345406 RepID=UPI00363DD388
MEAKVAFWWASQGNNYPVAIDQGSLWTCPRINGALPPDRALLKQLRVGDLVFHHYDSHVRAISVVTASWRDAPRTSGYPNKYVDRLNNGWLVTVDPLITGLMIHFQRVAQLLPHGAPGPLDKNGTPQQKYLSPLTDEQGRKLLDAAGLFVPDSFENPCSAPPPTASDATQVATRRVEQALLRTFLLQGQETGACELCGRLLPASLLVAGHIKPRAQCTEAERWAFSEVAMLVCVLGCDALFEHGYLTVDDTGTINPGRTPSHDIIDTVHPLLGRPCPAHTPARAAAFRAHRGQFTQLR